ncbi:MAG: hypothetical protein NVS9B2_27280 [Steroidobacteraceae bacterium]
MLAACGAPGLRHAAPQGPGERAAEPNLESPGRNYRIDENQSELKVLVYRAGPLARFGHNHVLVNRAIRGSVTRNPAGASMFSLIVPAAGFVVDDAQARREEGPDFAGDIPEEAKSGTLNNLRGTAVLDADEFPSIAVHGVAVSGSEDASGRLVASVAFSVAGHESNIDVPFTVASDSHQLSASGSLELRQSALGLIPYSLMLGALQVQDALTVKFKIVARPT